MAFPAIAVDGLSPPFEALASTPGALPAPQFAFWLNRQPDSQEGGELVLGGADPDHYSGEITWCAFGDLDEICCVVGDLLRRGRSAVCTW